MLLDLIHNIALLIALAICLQILTRRIGRHSVSFVVSSGFLFGIVCVIGMMTPLRFAPGVIYDGRSIVLSLAGLFGGPLTAAVAALLSGAYRIYLGGAGAVAGVSTIIESAALGTILYYLRRHSEFWVRWVPLWLFGMLVHIIMLALQLLIPGRTGWDVLSTIGLPVLFFYPLAFLLTAQLFLEGERKQQVDKALRESEERWQFALEGSGDGVWDWNIPTSEVFFSRQWKAMLGFGEDEIGNTIEDRDKRIHPEDRDYVYTEVNRHFTGQSPVYMSKHRVQCKDGTYKWILDRGKVIQWTRDGNPLRLIGTHTDITELKKSEEALRESEEKYRLVVENANDAIFIAQDGMIKFPNSCLSKMSGYTTEELTSVPLSHFLHPDDKEMVSDKHQRRLKGEDFPATYSFRIINKAGETVWAEISVVLIRWEGRPATLNFLRDITIQKKLEDQLIHAQKMEAVGTLAGGVAHDFNNILTGILGYASMMLMETDKTHPFYQKLKIIEQQVESAADLTKQLLGFARGGKYEVRPVNVNDLIMKTSDVFGRTKKEITIHRKLQEDLHTVEADRGQIEQVFMNLYLNAWQAMPSGGELYLETQNTFLGEEYCRGYGVKPGAYIKIAVTDTGTGMDAETQKRIYEPFFTTKGPGKGTGLGLASSYGIVRNHGGVINVYSEKGHGATFTVYLPASEKEPAETDSAEGKLLKGDETILIVDDEPVNTGVVKELLEILGYKALTAQSGKEAIKLYREHSGNIHLVILDMIMPEMNGKETLVKLMEIDKNVRVLLASGYSIHGEAKTILELGCRGFIQKPFKLDELSQKIRETLDRTGP